MTTAKTVEELIAEKNLTAPRVTPDHIESVIANEEYIHHNGTTLTICILTLQNGYTLTGTSGCADPANYNEEVGNLAARNNAKGQIWPLEGYLLKQRLHDASVGEV